MPNGMLMTSLQDIDNALRFIVIEVTKQIEDTYRFLKKANPQVIEKIHARDDYIDNLKSVIENKCFSSIFSSISLTKEDMDHIKAVNIIGNNLEHIADHAVNIVEQMKYFQTRSFLDDYDYKSFFREILHAIRAIPDALSSRDIDRGLKICRSEVILDELFKTNFDKILHDLKNTAHTENLLTTLFILRYLERIGDCLLNIGEAVISVVLGEKLKIHQYEAVEETLSSSDLKIPSSDFSFEVIAETRSGCRIGRIKKKNQPDAAQSVLFKEGKREKVAKEKLNIEKWEQLVPGLSPKIYAYHECQKNASLLLEYIEGNTLKDILLHGDMSAYEHAFDLLVRSLTSIWDRTYQPGPASGDYMRQLDHRMEDVFETHPEFEPRRTVIGEIETEPLDTMIERARKIESLLPAPFTVFIHGDFNVDNIMYNPYKQSIHFIDLHRSSQKDMVQDISVFIVSNFRLPVSNEGVRHKLNRIIIDFFQFARSYAEHKGDTTFQARLALGLIRSFITSTRFEFDRHFSKAMFHRAIFLLEKISSHGSGSYESFKVPEYVLTYS